MNKTKCRIGEIRYNAEAQKITSLKKFEDLRELGATSLTLSSY
jgi:hypothetical protein